MVVLHSGTPSHEIARISEEFPEAEFVECEDLGDWGHDKRARGIERATEEWIGFFNDDDDYSERYLELMLAQTGVADVVYCSWNSIPDCQFKFCSSTSGNFLVRAELARQVGWPWRHYGADGEFINTIAGHANGIARVDTTLYFWNEGIHAER